ncbi:MAG: GIY-YIG nuclease family protein [Aminivibrio sp.]|jgi:putative endonuclease
MNRTYYIYLLTNIKNRVLYTGVTNNLKRRVYEHKHGLVEGFTKKYRVHKLVCYEEVNDVNAAIAREKEIKAWRREKKNALIEKENPEWNDLSAGWYDDSTPPEE